MHAAVLSAQRHFYRLVGGASEGAACFERDGVLAAVVPAAAERSVVNAATYEHPGALRDAYDDLAAAYNEIGARWTVWVHHDDAEAAALLAERGHVLDSQPEAMARTLASPPSRPPLEGWTSAGSMEDVGTLNDVAYGYDGSLRRALAVSRVTACTCTCLGRMTSPSAASPQSTSAPTPTSNSSPCCPRPAGAASRASCSPTRWPTPPTAARRPARWWPAQSAGRSTSASAIAAWARSRCGSAARHLSATFSSNMTSPSSVRCTGHFAAICISFSR